MARILLGKPNMAISYNVLTIMSFSSREKPFVEWQIGQIEAGGHHYLPGHIPLIEMLSLGMTSVNMKSVVTARA